MPNSSFIDHPNDTGARGDDPIRSALERIRATAAEARQLAADLNSTADHRSTGYVAHMNSAYAMAAKHDWLMDAVREIEAALSSPLAAPGGVETHHLAPGWLEKDVQRAVDATNEWASRAPPVEQERHARVVIEGDQPRFVIDDAAPSPPGGGPDPRQTIAKIIRRMLAEGNAKPATERSEAAADAILAALSAPPGWRPTHRHVKRGTDYQLLGAAVLQTKIPLSDNSPVVAYRDRDGDLWVRAMSEFHDGRFEPISAAHKDGDT